MKNSARRANSFRSSPAVASDKSTSSSSSSSIFWLIFHALCCLISVLLGFRFSRLLFFLLFSSNSYTSTPTSSTNYISATIDSKTLNLIPPASPNLTGTSRVIVGRHGILIRPWPHPDPIETAKAHRIMERVQEEQRIQYGAKDPRPIIVVTPTYVRTFQALHLTGLMHTLMNVKYDLTWIVVEAGKVSNETWDLIGQSGIRTIHLGFEGEMPMTWAERHRVEALMRIEALRVVRDRRLDGIVVFADDSNMHSLELFDEIQKVKWVGAVSVGILAHSGNSDPLTQNEKSEDDKNMPLPIQGPACNSSNQLVGWHTFNSLPFMGKSATFVGDVGIVLPTKMEWAGFVINSRLLWREAKDKPEWGRDLDSVGANGEEIESPLVLLKDATFVEPLGNCGKKVLLWWLRVEARSDSKFPPGWIIDPPLDITVPAKRTPWPDAPPELPSEKLTANQDHINMDKHSSKSSRSSRPKHTSRSKRKHEHNAINTQASGVSRVQAN